MSGTPRVSVVVRAKDEAAGIGRTLELLAAQTLAADSEVIVVDSGSTDGTQDIARAAGARVIEIPAESFTYGGALNTGTEAARAPIIVALSAHAYPHNPRWLELMAAAIDRDGVACATPWSFGPDGHPMTEPILLDVELAREWGPLAGYSNHAGAYRRELWARRPFRADLPATEDKEWAWHWMLDGWTVALDPTLEVEHSHGDDPLPEQFRKLYWIWVGLGMFREVDRPSLREALGEWWGNLDNYPSHIRARLSPGRMARLAGAYWGRRAAWRAQRDAPA